MSKSIPSFYATYRANDANPPPIHVYKYTFFIDRLHFLTKQRATGHRPSSHLKSHISVLYRLSSKSLSGPFWTMILRWFIHSHAFINYTVYFKLITIHKSNERLRKIRVKNTIDVYVYWTSLCILIILILCKYSTRTLWYEQSCWEQCNFSSEYELHIFA